MRNNEQKLIHALAQKEYDQKVLKSAYKEQLLLKKLNELYSEEMLEDIYEKVVEGKQKLIHPVSIQI